METAEKAEALKLEVTALRASLGPKMDAVADGLAGMSEAIALHKPALIRLLDKGDGTPDQDLLLEVLLIEAKVPAALRGVLRTILSFMLVRGARLMLRAKLGGKLGDLLGRLGIK
jgi:hypothetical protein